LSGFNSPKRSYALVNKNKGVLRTPLFLNILMIAIKCNQKLSAPISTKI